MHLLGGKWKFTVGNVSILNFENKHFKLPVSIFETGSIFENYFGANKSSKLMFILLNQLFESVVKSPLVL